MFLITISGNTLYAIIIILLAFVAAGIIAILKYEKEPFYRLLYCLVSIVVPPFAVCYLLYRLIEKKNRGGA